MSTTLSRIVRLGLVIAAFAVWHLMARVMMYYLHANDVEYGGPMFQPNPPRPGFSVRYYSWGAPMDVIGTHFLAFVALVVLCGLVCALLEIGRWIWSGD